MTAAEALSECGIPVSEARLLLAAVSGLSRAAQAAHPETLLTEAAAASFRRSLVRRRLGEPIAYLLGEREFYNLALSVTPDVLIPRPETELLVDFALENLPANGSLLDLGTGSGAIALAVKHERPDAQVTGIDSSKGAIAVAQVNASRHGIDVELIQGNWFERIPGRRFDIVVSNPPYVAEGDRHLVEGDVRFEPRSALVGGRDGLDAVRTILASAAAHLRQHGWIALEHGQGQDPEVRALLAAAGFESIFSRPDLAGIARISGGKYNLE
jgi:release factor glutamine methyltransferase